MKFVILNVGVSLASFETDFQEIMVFYIFPKPYQGTAIFVKTRKNKWQFTWKPTCFVLASMGEHQKRAFGNLEVITKKKHQNR
jgi:hypothetical protein